MSGTKGIITVFALAECSRRVGFVSGNSTGYWGGGGGGLLIVDIMDHKPLNVSRMNR